MDALLTIKDLAWPQGSRSDPTLAEVNFTVNEGNVLVLSGKSGTGKSTLLKCLAHLNLYDGQILLYGRTPKSFGIPQYRTRVLYVPQRPALLPSTPHSFLTAVQGFSSRKSTSANTNTDFKEAVNIGERIGIERELWEREWVSLSGGEAQRLALAIALSLKGTEILLLDEPTSALDTESSSAVESILTDLPKNPDSTVKAIVWVTHSEEQAGRVATRRVRVEGGRVVEDVINLRA